MNLVLLLFWADRLGSLGSTEKFLQFCTSILFLMIETNTNTVGFWCQTIHKKFLRRFDTIFGLKKWSRKNYFEIPRWPLELLLPSAKKSAQKG